MSSLSVDTAVLALPVSVLSLYLTSSVQLLSAPTAPPLQIFSAPHELELRQQWQQGARRRRSSPPSLPPQVLEQQQGPGIQVGTVIAGALSRTMAQACMYPLDTFKTRLQLQAPVPALQAWQAVVHDACHKIKAAPWQLPALLAKGGAHRGFAELYTGLTGALCTALPAGLLFFTADNAVRNLMAHHFGKDKRAGDVHLLAVSAGTLASSLVRVPGDVIKHRVQAFMFPNVWQAAQHTLQRQGLRGMFCGFNMTLMRDIPDAAIQFALYEALRSSVSHWQRGPAHLPAPSPSPASPALQGSPSHAAVPMCSSQWLDLLSSPAVLGGLAGGCSSFMTTPLDVLKTQLQCHGSCSLSGAIQATVASKGLAGLMAGVGPRVLQATLSSALFFTVFEGLKAHLAAPEAAPIAQGLSVRPLPQEQLAPLASHSGSSCALTATTATAAGVSASTSASSGPGAAVHSGRSRSSRSSSSTLSLALPPAVPAAAAAAPVAVAQPSCSHTPHTPPAQAPVAAAAVTGRATAAAVDPLPSGLGQRRTESLASPPPAPAGCQPCPPRATQSTRPRPTGRVVSSPAAPVRAAQPATAPPRRGMAVTCPSLWDVSQPLVLA